MEVYDGPVPVSLLPGAPYASALEEHERSRESDAKGPCMFVVRVLILGMIAVLLLVKLNFGTGIAFALSIPGELPDPDNIAAAAQAMLAARPAATAAGFVALYLALQTLSLPGCTLLNMAAGAAVGPGAAFPMVSLLVAAGSTFSFGFSHRYCRELILGYLPDRLSVLRPVMQRAQTAGGWRGVVMEIWFMRLMLFTPAWVLNMTAPHIGVPASALAVASFLGAMPRNLYTVVLGLDAAAFFEVVSKGWSAVAIERQHEQQSLGMPGSSGLGTLPPATSARLFLGAVLVFSPVVFRRYSHIKPGCVASYSDLYQPPVASVSMDVEERKKL